MKIDLSVVIPSRTQEKQIIFLERSISSIYNQSIADKFNIDVIVAVDKGCHFDSAVLKNVNFRVIESDGASQAKALNAGIGEVRNGLTAFLEDDDHWDPRYLEFATLALLKSDFVSSTQSERDENNDFKRVNDFPTPSGWVMRSTLLKNVGYFNESYRFHLDNEWLGRLRNIGASRVHLVESTAPTELELAQSSRHWLANVLKLSNGCVELVRHESPYPLINRLVHSKSGMHQISTNLELHRISMDECKMLVDTFGNIPW
jgi:hypothetical protein